MSVCLVFIFVADEIFRFIIICGNIILLVPISIKLRLQCRQMSQKPEGVRLYNILRYDYGISYIALRLAYFLCKSRLHYQFNKKLYNFSLKTIRKCRYRIQKHNYCHWKKSFYDMSDLFVHATWHKLTLI